MRDLVLLLLLTIIFSGCSDGAGSGLAGTGVSGSTARFAVVGDYLYVLNKFDDKREVEASDRTWSTRRLRDSLDTFSLVNPESPEFKTRLILESLRPETIYPVGANLFLGTDSGMMIISIEEPSEPLSLSFTGHFTARDPVVVSGDRAYVTLRTSEKNKFSSAVNELQIYDIRNLDMPTLINTFQMTSPWGLGVQHDRAYICDGSSGLRVLNVADPQLIEEVAVVNTDICFDVVITQKSVISTGLSGINQYKIDADTAAPSLLSTIALAQPK
jgi:hypothetical protein